MDPGPLGEFRSAECPLHARPSERGAVIDRLGGRSVTLRVLVTVTRRGERAAVRSPLAAVRAGVAVSVLVLHAGDPVANCVGCAMRQLRDLLLNLATYLLGQSRGLGLDNTGGLLDRRVLGGRPGHLDQLVVLFAACSRAEHITGRESGRKYHSI